MKYAVIKTGGKQYKISEGQVLTVEKLDQPSSNEKDKAIEFDEVLLLVNDGKVKVGQPKIQSNVKARVIDQVKGKKIYVSKYKAKTGYRRRIGHRQNFTKVLIEKIGD